LENSLETFCGTYKPSFWGTNYDSSTSLLETKLELFYQTQICTSFSTFQKGPQNLKSYQEFEKVWTQLTNIIGSYTSLFPKEHAVISLYLNFWKERLTI
jgi:hypothetical protein